MIRRILTNPTEQERYAAYLGAALRLDVDEVAGLLWEHPRPLLTQVLPTALRRLRDNWRAHGRKAPTIRSAIRRCPSSRLQTCSAT